MNTTKISPRHITVRLLRSNDEKEILKALRGKHDILTSREQDRHLTSIKTDEVIKKWHTYFQRFERQ